MGFMKLPLGLRMSASHACGGHRNRLETGWLIVMKRHMKVESFYSTLDGTSLWAVCAFRSDPFSVVCPQVPAKYLRPTGCGSPAAIASMRSSLGAPNPRAPAAR